MRSIATIAYVIRRDWTKLHANHPAYPYLAAMASLDSLEDRYIMEQADMIVRYFLVNATTWKGEVARAVKAELKSGLADFDKARRR